MATKAQSKNLAKFSISGSGDEYQIEIEDEAGDTLELTASYEQLELLADTLDELLKADESAVEVDADA